MNTVGKKGSLEKRKILYIIILLIGAVARIYRLASAPGGINQDEAFGAREAWSLLHSGIDSFGYSWPVYLTTWGSGMSVGNSLLMASNSSKS